MSQSRIETWNDRAKTYLALPAVRKVNTPSKAEFRARFKKSEFDKALERLGVNPERT